jgi:flagellar biosynthesis chaperone FliJ
MSADKPQVRECWRVLADQAEVKVARIQTEINLIREHIQGLELSHQRVNEMVNDYLNPSVGQQLMQGMQQMHDSRQFANQMMELMQRIRNDISKSKKMLADVQLKRVKAEQERLKMAALMEKDQQALARYEQKKEQALMDAAGLVQFNLGLNV